MDQIRAVVGRDNAHAGWQRGRDFGDALLHGVDHLQRVLAMAHDDDATHRLPLPIQLRDPEAEIGTHRHAGDIADAHRAPPCAYRDSNLRDVFHAAEIAEPADHIVRASHLYRARADVLVRAPHRLDDLSDLHTVCEQPGGVEQHLVLAHIAAETRDLGDAGHGLQRVANLEILNGAEPIRRIPRAFKRILEHPSDAGGIRAEACFGRGGQTTLDRVEVLEHTRARPVEVGTVLEDHVHE